MERTERDRSQQYATPLGSHIGGKNQKAGHSSTAFLGTAAGAQMCALTECWHCRQRFNLLFDNVRPEHFYCIDFINVVNYYVLLNTEYLSTFVSLAVFGNF